MKKSKKVSKKICLLILVMVMVLGSISTCFASSWSWQDDTAYIPDGTEKEYALPAWAAKYNKYGILLEDPNREITRGEFYALMLRSGGEYLIRNGDERFCSKDINESEKTYFEDRLEYSLPVQDEIIVAAYLHNVIPEHRSKALFNEPITRCEAASIISAYHYSRTERYMDIYGEVNKNYWDVPDTKKYWLGVNAATTLGLMSGKTKNCFYPDDHVTLLETIVINDNLEKISLYRTGEKLTKECDIFNTISRVFKVKQ